MVVRGIFDAGIGETAAAIVIALRALAQAADVVEDLRLRIVRMLFRRLVEARPKLAVIVAQVRGGELVLRGEAAIEAGLGDAGASDDLIDADRADALAIEQLTRRL